MSDDLLPERYVRVRMGRHRLTVGDVKQAVEDGRDLWCGYRVDPKTGVVLGGPDGATRTLVIFKTEDIVDEMRISKTYGTLVKLARA